VVVELSFIRFAKEDVKKVSAIGTVNAKLEKS
jgi:hypothetical protein